MMRILLIGCGGSGKSTLARKLGATLGLPVVHLDRLYWREGWQPVPKETFDALLDAELAKPRWIIDGNFDRTMAHRLEHCDTAIYLDYSRLVCLVGVLRRVARSWGRSRPDMGPGCPERLDGSFLQWVWHYRAKHGPTNDRLLAQAAKNGVNVLRFRTRRQCARWLCALETR